MKKPGVILGKIVRAFKAVTTRRIHQAQCCTFGWQRGYYDHIIRNAADLERIRRYIENNPLRWYLDRQKREAAWRELIAGEENDR